MSLWRALALALLAVGWGWAGAQAAPGADALLELGPAQVLMQPWSEAAQPPPETDLRWQSLGLHEALRNPTFELVRVWYRMRFTLAAPVAQPWSVLLPRIYTGGQVLLDGVPVGEVAGTSPASQANWLRPHVFDLPTPALTAGEHTLTLVVASRYARVVIGAPRIGAQQAVHRVYWDRLFWEYTVPMVSVWLLLVGALFVLVIWALRRQESLYGLFGLAMLGWGVRTIHFVWPVIPLPVWVAWRAAYFGGTGFGIVLMSVFSLRLCGFRHPGVERLALAWAGAGPVAMVVLRNAFERWEVAWYACGMLFIAFAVGVAVRHAWRRRSLGAAGLIAAPAIVFAVFMRDYAVKAGWLGTGHVFIAHGVAPLVMLAMCLVLLLRFVNTLARVENFNAELAQRVREREDELTRSHEGLMQLRLAQASAAERQRIVQDMHDGLGSQLLSSLTLVERGAASPGMVAQMLRECMDEMRLVVDALAPDEDDLLSVLGALRYRMAPRMAAAGCALQWQVRCPDDTVQMEPRERLAVLRIVQEALANVLKHACGARVQVGIEVADGFLEICVADDGPGLGDAPHGGGRRGRGLVHMRQRAEAMGAQLDIAASPQGTIIRLRKPLRQALSLSTPDLPQRGRDGFA